MKKSDFQQEENYLNKVEGVIRGKLARLRDLRTPLKGRVLQERKEMWEENRHQISDFDDVILLSVQEADVRSAEEQYEQNELEIGRLEKMEKSPYFGRLDYEEKETGEKDTVYIGTYGLAEDETHEICVVDWRAPVSAMFYHFGVGPAWYQVRDYREEVCVTGKRRYRIEEGRLLRAYDTESSMDDDILDRVLSEHSDHKLKVIAASIQKEQDLAIRSDPKRSCLIYGLAGSGKTSIGLHRVAYVLYNLRDTVKSENVLVLSNNHIFSSYVSSILPDLGEMPPRNMVFADILETFMDEGVAVEDYYSQLKWLDGRSDLTRESLDPKQPEPNSERANPVPERSAQKQINWALGQMKPALEKEDSDSARLKYLRLKYSAGMIRYCTDYFASFAFQAPEIRYKGKLVIAPESGENDRQNRQADRALDFKARRSRLEHRIRQSIEEFFETNKEEICRNIEGDHEEYLSAWELRLIYERLLQSYLDSAQEKFIRLNRLDPGKQAALVLAAYLRRAGEEEEEAVRFYESLKHGVLWYEDALFLLFVKTLMGEAAPFSNILHTVIDESQDYSLLQLHIMKRLLPRSSFTLLGDICQTVNTLTTIQEYDAYENVFGPGLVRIRLSKCYRSSGDINALAFALIGAAEGYSYFQRMAGKPRYIISQDPLSCIAPILERFKKYHSAAVITNSGEEARAVWESLRGRSNRAAAASSGAGQSDQEKTDAIQGERTDWEGRPDRDEVQLIESPEDELKGRVVILPFLLAKGLEFDAVILYHCVHSNEGNDSIRRKVYLGCTRALHELYLVESRPLPEALRGCEEYLEIEEWE